jgi:hypothetical protein
VVADIKEVAIQLVKSNSMENNRHGKNTASYYPIVLDIQHLLAEGKVDTARKKLETLREAIIQTEQQALRGHLIRLMIQVLKWKTLATRRTQKSSNSIEQERQKIQHIQKEIPTLNKTFIQSIWDYCLQRAIHEAQTETGFAPAVANLSWQEVFEDGYTLSRD